MLRHRGPDSCAWRIRKSSQKRCGAGSLVRRRQTVDVDDFIDLLILAVHCWPSLPNYCVRAEYAVVEESVLLRLAFRVNTHHARIVPESPLIGPARWSGLGLAVRGTRAQPERMRRMSCLIDWPSGRGSTCWQEDRAAPMVSPIKSHPKEKPNGIFLV